MREATASQHKKEASLTPPSSTATAYLHVLIKSCAFGSFSLFFFLAVPPWENTAFKQQTFFLLSHDNAPGRKCIMQNISTAAIPLMQESGQITKGIKSCYLIFWNTKLLFPANFSYQNTWTNKDSPFSPTQRTEACLNIVCFRKIS